MSNTPWYPGKLLCCSTDRMPSELQLLNLSVSWTRYKYVWAHKPVGNKSIVIRARNPCAGRIFLGPMDMLYGNLVHDLRMTLANTVVYLLGALLLIVFGFWKSHLGTKDLPAQLEFCTAFACSVPSAEFEFFCFQIRCCQIPGNPLPTYRCIHKYPGTPGTREHR